MCGACFAGRGNIGGLRFWSPDIRHDIVEGGKQGGMMSMLLAVRVQSYAD